MGNTTCKIINENAAYQQLRGRILRNLLRKSGYEHEHIPGAIDFMYDADFVAKAPEVLPNKHDTILVYCDYGGVSKLAAQDLADAGYTNVVEFNGMEVWTGATESGPDSSKGGASQDKPIPWAEWASGLLLGISFGYAVKRSRFCMTGLIRDTYLEHRVYNIILVMTIVCIVGLLYFVMGQVGLIRLPLYLPPFSLFSIAVGSFMFGFGAVMGQGCLISNGLVGTAQFSLKSWYALLFLVAGILLASRIFLKPRKA